MLTMNTADYEYNLRSIMNDVSHHEATMRLLYGYMWNGKIYRVRALNGVTTGRILPIDYSKVNECNWYNIARSKILIKFKGKWIQKR